MSGADFAAEVRLRDEVRAAMHAECHEPDFFRDPAITEKRQTHT